MPNQLHLFSRWLIAFILLNTLVMAAISAFIVPGDMALLSKIYIAAALPAQFLLLNILLGLGVFLVSLSVPWMAWKKALSLLCFSLVIFIVLVNNYTFLLYRFHINGMVINLVFGGALLNNLSFSFSMWLSVLGSGLGIAALGLALLWLANKLTLAFQFSLLRSALVALAFLMAMALSHGFSDAFGWRALTATDPYIPWLQPITMKKKLKKMGFSVVDSRTIELNTKSTRLNYPKEPLHCSAAQPLNIIMIVVDSLRADVLTEAVMPNTYQLQQNALVFEQHFSTGNATRYGIFGLMYGLSANYWDAMLNEQRGSVLFDATQQLAYNHAIYGSAPLTNPEFDRTVFSALKVPLHQGSHKTSDANDQEITTNLLADIKQRNPQQPFFGFIFFDAPHAYAVPKQLAQQFTPMLDAVNYMELHNNFDPTPFFNRYKAATYFNDQLIGNIVAELKANQMLDNTVIIITGDHGQEFNDTHKNYWGHNSNFAKWQTQVPLLILWPNQTPRKITSMTSHEDIVPTLLTHALGCTTAITQYSTGYDLLGELPQHRQLLLKSWSEQAIRTQDQLYVFDPLGALRIVDETYTEQNAATADPKILQAAMQKMQQFLK
jgi:uncharacterized protein